MRLRLSCRASNPVSLWYVLLVSIMRADITPFAPMSLANPLYQAVSVPSLHAVCVLSGGLAVVWLLLRSNKSRERTREMR